MNYVIIGGDAAGMSAAMQIMKYDQSANITILEKGAHYSYGQCGMPYVIGGLIDSTDELIVRDAYTYKKRFGMDARVHHEVTNIDTESQMIYGIHVETKQAFEIAYDKLLIATGASPFIPNWPGRDLEGVHTLKTIPETDAIIEDIAKGVNDITIVGGGYIALEMAENFKRLNKNVRLLIRSGRLMKVFDSEISEKISEEAKKHMIEIAFYEEIEEVIGDEKLEAVRTNKRTIQTDLLLVATGVQPNTSFLKQTNIQVSKNEAIKVNSYMETNMKNVYAAGDCAEQYHLIKQKSDYIPLGTNANKQGRIAGMNMVGKVRKFKGIVGTSILQFMDLALGKTGLSNEEAEELGISFQSKTIDTNHIAGYYPNTKPISIKLTYQKDGLILGGQIFGEEGVDKRIDVLATALFNKMNAVELEDLDLNYAPPFNSVWDPLQQIARKIVSELDES